jgi:hypothetical protein
MHEFYQRVQAVFELAGSNRNQFCRKWGYNYQTMQAYWNTDKLPPGNVLEDLAKEFNVSLDALVLGGTSQDVRVENPKIKSITAFLEQQDEQTLLQIEGTLKMFKYMTLFSSPLPSDSRELVNRSIKMESLTDLLTQLARRIQRGTMSKKDKEASKEMLKQIVLNIYEREVEANEEWAELEELE